LISGFETSLHQWALMGFGDGFESQVSARKVTWAQKALEPVWRARY